MKPELISQWLISLLTSGGVAALIWKLFFGKRREGAEVNNLVLSGAKVTMEMSDVINKIVDNKTLERTHELRELIAANEFKHYKEVTAQGQVYAANMAKTEEAYEQKIKVLYQKLDTIEKEMSAQVSKLEKDFFREMDMRTNCLKQLAELQKETGILISN